MSIVTVRLIDKMWIIEKNMNDEQIIVDRIAMNSKVDEIIAKCEAKNWAEHHRPCKYIEIDITGYREEKLYQ